MTSVTILNTMPDPQSIATRREITGYTPPDGEDPGGDPIYGDAIVLERIAPGQTVFGFKWSSWARPTRTAQHRADPASYGMDNFLPGERILDVVDVKPSLGAYERLGAMGEGVADLEAGTMTHTWAKISADAFDPATHHPPVWNGSSWDAAVAKDSGDLAADLAARKAAMFEQCRLRFRAVRDAGTAIDFGGGPVAVQTTPEAANDVARLHDDLVFQAVNGVSDPTQAIATSEYVVVPAVTIAMAAAMREAVAAHWRATWACDAAVGAAIVVAADHAALDLVDVAAGTIDGVGGWPS